jgi:malate dehydrogenase
LPHSSIVSVGERIVDGLLDAREGRDDCQIDNNSSGMSAIVILGAGELGGSLAHVLARQDLASVVHLVDDAGSVAEGKALDIAQSAPIEEFATRVSGSTQLAQAAGADLIFVADRFKSGEWKDDAGLQLLKQVAQFAPRRVIVCAGAAHRLLVEQAVRELKFPRNAVLGSAPEALASAIRSLTAVEAGTSAADVALTVLGIPPSGIVVPWEESSIGGFSAINVLDEVTRRRLSARIAPLWPPGPYSLAAAAAKTAAAILGRSRQRVSVFVGPDDSEGRRTRAAALPVRLGQSGIAGIELPGLNVHDRVALDTAMLL